MFVGTQTELLYTKVGRLNYCWEKLHLLDDTPMGVGGWRFVLGPGLNLFRITILAFN